LVILKGRDHAEDLDINGKIILEWILEKLGRENVDWIHLSQDRDHWQTPVNTVMKLWFHKRRGIFCPSEGKLCPM
jgi:hypothetical protein